MRKTAQSVFVDLWKPPRDPPRAFNKRPNKTGTKQVFFRKRNHSDQPWYVCRSQSSEFLQPARVEMLEKVSNSQAKPGKTSINNKFPSQLIGTPVFLPGSKIPLGNR